MKYPCLVPKRLCKTDITVSIAREGVSKYGEPLEPVTYTGRCNYQDKAKTIFTEEKKLVQITGSALFPGDICPELPTISGGTAIIFGVQRQIQEARKKTSCRRGRQICKRKWVRFYRCFRWWKCYGCIKSNRYYGNQ